MNAFLDCLKRLDVNGIRKVWAKMAPHLPQPKNDEETLTTLHMARVKSLSMTNQEKAYSAAWLTEREIEEREKIISKSVGHSSNAADIGLKTAIESAMSRAVITAMDGGLDLEKDAKEINKMMLDARAKVKSGRISV